MLKKKIDVDRTKINLSQKVDQSPMKNDPNFDFVLGACGGHRRSIAYSLRCLLWPRPMPRASA